MARRKCCCSESESSITSEVYQEIPCGVSRLEWASASATAISRIETSLKSTSIWEKLKTMMRRSAREAAMHGQKMFLPERIHSAMMTSIAPKRWRSSSSFGTIAKANEGKYPIHASGLKNAEIGG